MLVLSRKVNEEIKIGNDITIMVIRIQGTDRVRLGISAPKDVNIVRSELVKDGKGRAA